MHLRMNLTKVAISKRTSRMTTQLYDKRLESANLVYTRSWFASCAVRTVAWFHHICALQRCRIMYARRCMAARVRYLDKGSTRMVYTYPDTSSYTENLRETGSDRSSVPSGCIAASGNAQIGNRNCPWLEFRKSRPITCRSTKRMLTTQEMYSFAMRSS